MRKKLELDATISRALEDHPTVRLPSIEDKTAADAFTPPQTHKPRRQVRRRVVTKNELMTLLTAQIRNVHGCEECLIDSIRLQDPDNTGCNWSDSVIVSGPGVSDQTRPAIERLIRAAQSRFNVLSSD